MALSFPLALSDFFDGIRVKSIEFDLGEALSMSQTGGGDVLTDSVGERLWGASVRLVVGRPAQMQVVRAKLNALREPGRSLMVRSVEAPYPAADPGGVLLGAAVPKIASLAANNRELTISDLPSGYEITAGDYLAFQYGSDPVRFAFHQVIVGGVASGSGVTDAIEVTPNIRPGASVGAHVDLAMPAFKAVIVPGTVKSGQFASKFIDGIGFSLIQTLR